jgi:hypothetical protein
MAVSFIGAGTWTFNANNVPTTITLTPTKHASTATGNVMVLISESRTIAGSAATPSGWNLVSGFPKTSGTASGGKVYVWTRTADGSGSDAPSVVWTGHATGTSGDTAGAGILSYSGLTETLDGTVQSSDLAAQTNTSVIPAFTTGTDNTLVIGVVFKIAIESGTSTVATFTERVDTVTTSGTGHIVEVSDKVQTPPGSSGTATVTWSNTTSARAFAVSLGLDMAPQLVPLQSSPAQSNATAALRAPTQIPLQPSGAQSDATASITTPIPLQTSFSTSNALTLELYAGAGVLARRFDGVDDSIDLGLGGTSGVTSAFTIAALVRLRTSTAIYPVFGIWNASNQAVLAIEFDNVGVPKVRVNNVLRQADQTDPNMALTPADGWAIYAVTKAAGTVVPNFHLFKGGTWYHAGSFFSLTATDPTGHSYIRAGRLGAGTNYGAVDLAVGGVWGANLSTGQVEELSANSKTLDWQNNSGGGPSGGWNYNQASTGTAITDFTGNGADQTAIGGTTTTPTGPAGWDYSTVAPVALTLQASGGQSGASNPLSVAIAVRAVVADIAFTIPTGTVAAAEIPLQASAAQSAATAAITARTAIPLQTSAAQSDATLSLRAKTEIPLQASAAQSSATADIKVQPVIPLQASAAQSDATLALKTGRTEIPLQASAAQSAATAALSAKTTITLQSSAAQSSATLALAGYITLQASAAQSAATASITTKTAIPLQQADALSSATATIKTGRTEIPLQASAAQSAATLALTVGAATIPLQAADALSSATLALKAKTEIPLQAAVAQSAATLALTVGAATIPLQAAAAQSSATATFTAQTAIPLQASAAVATALLTLGVQPQIPLQPADAISGGLLTVTTTGVIPLQTAVALSGGSAHIIAPHMFVLPVEQPTWLVFAQPTARVGLAEATSTNLFASAASQGNLGDATSILELNDPDADLDFAQPTERVLIDG